MRQRYSDGSGASIYPGAMALADIPAVYVIGAPRSGTTWLQLMLGSHPQVATPVELAFFSDYAAPWYEKWERQCAGGSGEIKPAYWGLPAALTEAELEEVIGLVVERIYHAVLGSKPGATLVVEKDPQYCGCVDVILRTVPHARFVHVLRDGRDVACSMMRVAQSWGSVWAPERPRAAGELWRDCVRAAQAAQAAPGGYLEVRYEDLLADGGPGLLREALAFCGVDDDPDLAARLYERYRYPTHRKEEVLSGGLTWGGEAARVAADVGFPDDFIGPGTAGRWKTELGPEDRQAFDSVAGDLLVELGYEPDTSWAGGRVRSWTPLPSRR
jgi:hypothetical protein